MNKNESSWEKLPPYENDIHQGCPNCPPVERIASMDMLVAVGFGCAMVTKDGEVIYMEAPDTEHYPTLAEFEAMAEKDPDHDWQITLEAPLRGRTYQRHEKGKWVLVDSNPGFA